MEKGQPPPTPPQALCRSWGKHPMGSWGPLVLKGAPFPCTSARMGRPVISRSAEAAGTCVISCPLSLGTSCLVPSRPAPRHLLELGPAQLPPLTCLAPCPRPHCLSQPQARLWAPRPLGRGAHGRLSTVQGQAVWLGSPTYAWIQRHFAEERKLQVLAHDLRAPGRRREYLRLFL